MDAKRFLMGTIAGGIAMFVVGYLFWGLLFVDFFASHSGSATGVVRESEILWATVLGTLSLAALVTLAVGSWAGATSIGEGLKIGATVGFLLWLGVDLIYYGAFNTSDLTGAIVDPLLEIVRTGIGGAVVALVVGGGTSE